MSNDERTAALLAACEGLAAVFYQDKARVRMTTEGECARAIVETDCEAFGDEPVQWSEAKHVDAADDVTALEALRDSMLGDIEREVAPINEAIAAARRTVGARP